jgi:glycosyltransferase involved in cell wall biosynthesis
VSGRLVEFKGVEDCIAVIARVQERLDVELVIAGDGGKREELEQVAAEALRPGSFTFLGALDPAGSLTVIAEADLLLSMSRTVRHQVGRPEYEHTETMGRSICEAVCNGVPVVAAGVGGVPEMVPPESGSLVAERDVDTAAGEVIEWLARGRPPHEAAAAARERFGWPEIFRQYDDLLVELCDGKESPTRRE